MARGTTCAAVSASILWLLFSVHDRACASERAAPPAATAVEKSAWKGVKAIRSTATFADVVTGNVVSRDGVELNDGKPAYLSTRLKIEGGKITEVELSSDVARANPAYVWNLPPGLTALVPRDQRMTRGALDALAHRYFQSLTDHKGVAADFDDARCNRFHSGNQVTNVKRDGVESQGARTCFTSIDGPKPWGPAVEQRFPVIDSDHGVVFGLTLLMYANQVMYVSEIFKVEGGRIVHVDNIGLVEPGSSTPPASGAASGVSRHVSRPVSVRVASPQRAALARRRSTAA